jgi:hypothetical protein
MPCVPGTVDARPRLRVCEGSPRRVNLRYKGRGSEGFSTYAVSAPTHQRSPRSARSRGRWRCRAAEKRARGPDELHAGAAQGERDPLHRHPRLGGLVRRHRFVAPGSTRALLGELRRLPRVARAGARPAPRHRLARGQLGLQRALRRDRERGVCRRSRRVPGKRIPRDCPPRCGDRPPLPHPDRPAAHHRPLPGARPERPAPGRRHRSAHGSRQVLAVAVLHASRAALRVPGAVPRAQARRARDRGEHPR